MRNFYITLISIVALSIPLSAQYTDTTLHQQPVKKDIYRIKNKIDLPLTGLGIAGTIYGFHLRESKPHNDSAEVFNLDPNSLPKMDRNATTQNHPAASLASDVLFAEGFVLPWFLYLDKHVRSEAYDYSIMYLETMGLTGMGYAMSAGIVKKYRPYAYNDKVALKRRANKHSSNSFYAGHVAVTAAGTFFAAKVFSDVHPDSQFRHVMWGLAGASTLGQCYARYKGGYHFITDISIGAVLGSTAGIIVPVLHKREKKGSALTMDPYIGEVPGITLRYTFQDRTNALSKSITGK